MITTFFTIFTVPKMSTSSLQEENQQYHFKLRLEFFQFERTVMESYLQNAIEKIQRTDTNFAPPSHKMLLSHNILEFVTPEISKIPAFDHFNFTVNLMQQTNPPCLYFMAQFIDVQKFFPQSAYLNMIYHRGVPSTMFKLNTQDGYLSIPPTKTISLENETNLANFQLSILLENLSFSTPPFENYVPVDIRQGNLYFPIEQKHLGQNTQVQQLYHHASKYNYPPPPIDPPRLFRRRNQDPDISVHWNTNYQSYVSDNQQRNNSQDQEEYLQELRSRTRTRAEQSTNRRPAEPTVLPRPSVQPISSSQSLPPMPVPSQDRPVIGQLNTEASVSPNIQAQPSQAQPVAAPPQLQTGNIIPTIPPVEAQIDGAHALPQIVQTTGIQVPQTALTVPLPQNASVDSENLSTDQERPYYNLSTLGHQELLRMKQMQVSNPLNQLDFFTNQQAYDWKTFTHDINAKFPRPTAQSEPRSLTLIPSTEDQYSSLSTRALESISDMNPLLDISNPQLIQKTSSTILALGTPSTIPPIIQPQSQKDPVPPQISPRFATRSTTGIWKLKAQTRFHKSC